MPSAIVSGTFIISISRSDHATVTGAVVNWRVSIVVAGTVVDGGIAAAVVAIAGTVSIPITWTVPIGI
jgi:hypothetical protein